MSKSNNQKSTIEFNYKSNDFIELGEESPVNANGSVHYYTSIYQANKDYILRHTLNYSSLVPQLQLDIFNMGNKWSNIIIELDRNILKKRIVQEIKHQTDKYKYYIVPYINSVPNQPITCSDLVTMLETVKDLITSKVRRYDYIIICNCYYNSDLYNGNGLYVVG